MHTGEMVRDYTATGKYKSENIPGNQIMEEHEREFFDKNAIVLERQAAIMAENYRSDKDDSLYDFIADLEEHKEEYVVDGALLACTRCSKQARKVKIDGVEFVGELQDVEINSRIYTGDRPQTINGLVPAGVKDCIGGMRGEEMRAKGEGEETGEVNCGLTVNDIIKGQFSEEENQEAYKRSRLYDEQIIAWTYYWNQKINGNIICEVPFSYQFEIDPNIVKAMVAQESSFGLMTEKTAAKNPSRNVMQSLATGNSVVWVVAGINLYENGMFKKGDSISFKRLDGNVGNDGALATDNLPIFTYSDLMDYRAKQHFEEFDILKSMFYIGEDKKYIVDFNKVTPNMSIATGIGELATKIEEHKDICVGVAQYNTLPGYVDAINRHLDDMGVEGLK